MVLLAAASAQNVFAATEIAYDSGSTSVFSNWLYEAVRFTPSGTVRIVGVEVYPHTYPISVKVFITGADHTTVLQSFTMSFISEAWQTMTISNGPIVSGDFFIVLELGTIVEIWGDGTNDNSRSYRGNNLPALSVWGNEGDLLIRALVEPASSAVGGVVLPTNTLAILTPYLALAGLVAVVSAAVNVKRKRT